MGLTCSPDNTYLASISLDPDFRFNVAETTVSFDPSLHPNDEVASVWRTWEDAAFTFDYNTVQQLVRHLQTSRQGFIGWKVEKRNSTVVQILERLERAVVEGALWPPESPSQGLGFDRSQETK